MVKRIVEDTNHSLSLTKDRSVNRNLLWLETLNQAQRHAVTSEARLLLVLAGAGSGKTRVLVCRIGWLMLKRGFKAREILAVTFTNKAAAEMRQRLAKMFNVSGNNLWVGTFHGIAQRLLRLHSQEAGLPEEFQIIDSQDQELLLKQIISELKLDPKIWTARDAQSYINKQKDKGRRASYFQNVEDRIKFTKCEIYKFYEMRCERDGLVDFAELLLRSLELLRSNPDLLAHYRDRFRHVLVDEFQDTNRIQYDWLRVLIGSNNGITIVGDDDQSIYRWRGARVENIRSFSADFREAEVILLEQNYRSTGTLLKAANAVISYNSGRLGKRLWTSSGEGDCITLYGGLDDNNEARFVVEKIQDHLRGNYARADIAILYRANAQFRALEKALMRRGVPYRIYGGQRFFDRLEIKNALAYLRLLVLRHDNLSFERIYNVPPRGIGERTFEQIKAQARSVGQSYWSASLSLIQSKTLSGRSLTALREFLNLIETLQQNLQGYSLADTIYEVIKTTELLAYHEKGDKGKARGENLNELVKIAHEFMPEEGEQITLSSFLNSVALDAGDTGSYNTDAVQLMTLHSAKGLEFPVVFIVGLEESLFPAYQSIVDPDGLEEERRLCYVGITRAMKKLYISYAENRWFYGKDKQNEPSRFIGEIPSSLIEYIR
jgi:DNA helicase-2/ATP-dependent DNA helicase PcrA